MFSIQFLVTFAVLAGLAWSASIVETRAYYPCVEGVLVLTARGSDHEWTNATELNPDYKHIGGMQDLGDEIAQTVGKDHTLGRYVSSNGGKFNQSPVFADSNGLGVTPISCREQRQGLRSICRNRVCRGPEDYPQPRRPMQI